MLVAAALAALASVLLAWRGLRGEPRRARRAALLALRAVAALAALFLLAEPALRVVQTARVRNRLAVLVDRSRSMNFPVEPGGRDPGRRRRPASWPASRPGLEALAAEATVEGWGFARDAWPADLAALPGPSPATGGATDLLGALRGAAGGSGAPGRRLAGVLLVSDGADNGALAARARRPGPRRPARAGRPGQRGRGRHATPRATWPSSGWRSTTSPSSAAPSPSRPRCAPAASAART